MGASANRSGHLSPKAVKNVIVVTRYAWRKDQVALNTENLPEIVTGHSLYVSIKMEEDIAILHVRGRITCGEGSALFRDLIRDLLKRRIVSLSPRTRPCPPGPWNRAGWGRRVILRRGRAEQRVMVLPLRLCGMRIPTRGVVRIDVSS